MTRGTGLRPTTEKVRAAIFSIIGREAVEGARVLDLYAGTGALGIEALSRGAAQADFVEARADHCSDIRENLRQLGLAEQGRVYRASVPKAIDRVEGQYDLVLADPPYELDPWALLMERLARGRLLNDGALVVIEHRHDRQPADEHGGLVRTVARRYGDTAVSIYRAGGTDA